MNDQLPLSHTAIRPRDRERLPHFVETAESSSRRHTFMAIAVILAPFLVLWGWEIGGRVVAPPDRPLLFPWHTLDSPYPPLWEITYTGDLTRMARLPHFSRPVANGPFPRRLIHRLSDEWGFINRPNGKVKWPVDDRHSIIVAGASYMAEGSSVERTFSAQLREMLGEPVYNAAWPNGGPVTTIVKMLRDREFHQGKERLVILGIIQRYLYAGSFEEIFDWLSEDGTLIEQHPDPPTLRETVGHYLNWHHKAEHYLETTSVPRAWAGDFCGWLPPMALDIGIDTPVRLACFQEDPSAAMLFYTGDIQSTYDGYMLRGGDRIADALKRIHQYFASRGIRFLVVLVPDKYEIYRDRVVPPLFPSPNPALGSEPQHPARRAPEVLAERLHELSVEAIDLFPALHKAQDEINPHNILYWVDDTHWNDDGIRVAVETVAAYLREKHVGLQSLE